MMAYFKYVFSTGICRLSIGFIIYQIWLLHLFIKNGIVWEANLLPRGWYLMVTQKSFKTIGGSALAPKHRDPLKWAQGKIRWALLDLLKPGEEELDDISSINGYPSKRGYLSILADLKKNTPGAESLLLAPEDKEEFLQIVGAEITTKRAKYKALLEELQKSAEAVSVYLSDLEKNKIKWNKVVAQNGHDREAEKFIKQTDELMEEYGDLLSRLTQEAATKSTAPNKK
jgi:hypothetical protein